MGTIHWPSKVNWRTVQFLIRHPIMTGVYTGLTRKQAKHRQKAILKQEIEHIEILEQRLQPSHNHQIESYLMYKKELKEALRQLE